MKRESAKTWSLLSYSVTMKIETLSLSGMRRSSEK